MPIPAMGGHAGSPLLVKLRARGQTRRVRGWCETKNSICFEGEEKNGWCGGEVRRSTSLHLCSSKGTGSPKATNVEISLRPPNSMLFVPSILRLCSWSMVLFFLAIFPHQVLFTPARGFSLPLFQFLFGVNRVEGRTRRKEPRLRGVVGSCRAGENVRGMSVKEMRKR